MAKMISTSERNITRRVRVSAPNCFRENEQCTWFSMPGEIWAEISSFILPRGIQACNLNIIVHTMKVCDDVAELGESITLSNIDPLLNTNYDHLVKHFKLLAILSGMSPDKIERWVMYARGHAIFFHLMGQIPIDIDAMADALPMVFNTDIPMFYRDFRCRFRQADFARFFRKFVNLQDKERGTEVVDYANRYRKHKLLMLNFKASVVMQMLGQLPRAQASLVDHQKILFSNALYCLSKLWCWFRILVLGPTFNFLEYCNSSFENMSEETYGLMCGVGEAMILIYVLYRLYHKLTFRYTLKDGAATDKRARFVSKKREEDGFVYTFIYKGEYLNVVEANERIDRLEEEMALPGSLLYPSAKRDVGAILVCTDTTELTLVGCFWRYGDYLVTARHVANTVATGVADVYLSGITKNRNKNFEIGKAHKIDSDFFDLDSNSYTKGEDVFVKLLGQNMWAATSVGKAVTKLDSCFKMTVNAVGFVNGVLMTSVGTTLDGSGPKMLEHTASTNKGFSGSPIYSGSSVVGMHVSGSPTKNAAVRIESITAWLPQLEAVTTSNVSSSEAYSEEYGSSLKYLGEDVEIFGDDDQEYSLVSKHSGRVRHRMSKEDIDRNFPQFRDPSPDQKELDNQQDMMIKFAQMLSAPKKRWIDYDDENLIELPREAPVHDAKVPKDNEEVVKFMTDNESTLTHLGYEPDKYSYPDMTKKAVELSMENHAKLYAERSSKIIDPPTLEEKRRCAFLVAEMLDANKWAPDIGYKTKSNILEIIQSTLVKAKKSPGHPFQEQGMATNASVMKRLTEPGLAELVLKVWDEKFVTKLMGKIEATKQAKLDANMMRLVQGMPLTKMIKHQTVFKNLGITAVSNWEKSPIVYAFTPVVPGHIKNLADRFGNDPVYSSDKPNWDWQFYEYLLEIVAEVIEMLAFQPIGMSDEEWENFTKDLHEALREVIDSQPMRCSSGRVAKTETNGVMISGSLVTIIANSIGQLVVDTIVKMRMDLTNEQILSPVFVNGAGGDDMLQKFAAGFDLNSYHNQARRLGIVLGDFTKHDTFEHAEFFSHTFCKKDGQWTYHPVRFTKHMYKLTKCKTEDLPSALASHMLNYCWDNKRFNFFRNMFSVFRIKYPDVFTPNFFKGQRQLQYSVLGLESC